MEILRLLLDFGLVILIWMVQLVVYPSFVFYPETDLIRWHQIYVKRISYVVIPLMFGQLFVSIWQAYQFPSIYTIGSLILIFGAWSSTFTQFVPRHKQISNTNFDSDLLNRLTNDNWLRTTLWTVVFIWTAMEVFIFV